MWFVYFRWKKNSMFNLLVDQSTLCKCSIHSNVVYTYHHISLNLNICLCHVIIRKYLFSVLVSADFWTQNILTMSLCMSVILPDILLLSNWMFCSLVFLVFEPLYLNVRHWGEVKNNSIVLNALSIHNILRKRWTWLCLEVCYLLIVRIGLHLGSVFSEL